MEILKWTKHSLSVRVTVVNCDKNSIIQYFKANFPETVIKSNSEKVVFENTKLSMYAAFLVEKNVFLLTTTHIQIEQMDSLFKKVLV